MKCPLHSAKDLDRLTSPGQHLSCAVPLTDIMVGLPTDGLPCINDWLTTVLSFLFSGSRLHREPLDVYVLSDPDDGDGPRLGIKKGFTRLKLDLQMQYIQFCFIFI